MHAPNAANVAAQALAAALHRQAPKRALYAPAPPKYQVVYDGGAGYDPGSTDARTVGQYADTNTNTVHTTKGFTKRQIAQDVGQIFASSVLAPGDRNYFSRLLGTDPANWENLHGAQPVGTGGQPGDEAFSNYYAIAATGGLKNGESLLFGDTPIDPSKLRQYTLALQRLGRRHGLRPYAP